MKNLVTTVKGWFGLFRPTLPARYSDGWQAGTPLDGAKALPVEGFSALRRGLEIVTGQLVSTPLLTFEEGVEMPSSPVAEALEATNPADLETAVSDMLTTGNGWLMIVRQDRTPIRLENIQASRMSAVVVGGTVEYRKDGKAIRESDYVHLQCRNYYNAFVGDPLVESYNASVASIIGTQTIFNQLQGNGSHAEVYLGTDASLTRDQMLQLRQAYNEQTANAEGKSGGVVILSNGLKPQTVKRLPSALDADIVQALNFSVAEAARMTGVPLSMLGVKDAVAYNSSIEMQRSFFRVTMKPLMHRVEQELSRKLGADVRYDVGEIALGYGVERAETLNKMIMGGIITINEARAAISYGPITNGENSAMQSNLRPLDQWVKPIPTPTAPTGV